VKFWVTGRIIGDFKQWHKQIVDDLLKARHQTTQLVDITKINNKEYINILTV